LAAPKKEKRQSKRLRKKRNVYFEPTYLRELLGLKDDVALELQKTANFKKEMSGTEAFGDKRVSVQPDISEDEQLERPENPSRRFKRFWASLTTAQKQALRMVYIKNPDRLTKVEIARKLGIRVDTLQERIDYAIKKLKRFFQEFDE
jgi:DNA-directed RNA polymerase specialized sigma24 family protein